MSVRWITGIAAALSLSLTPPDAHPAANSNAHSYTSPQQLVGDGELSPPDPRAILPRFVVAETADVRSAAVCGEDVWVATAGGVERYAGDRRWRSAFGTEAGLDTLDVRRVWCAPTGVAVETANSECDLAGHVFLCKRRPSTAPVAPGTEWMRGKAVTARLRVRDGQIVGTAGAGLFFEPASGDAVRLDSPDQPPASFVRTVAVCKGRTWIGTFDAGLYVVDALPEALMRDPGALQHARPVVTSFRMINQALVAGGALYVAANEGLFVSTDGIGFAQVPDMAARAVTGLAADGHALYVTTTSALWRLRLERRGSVQDVWWRPAGSRSLQGVAVGSGGVWLASEDRGAIRFDGKAFAAYDKLAGLPTSWVLSIAEDDEGGVFAATLRDGAIHVDRSGRWERLGGLPSAWTLGVFRGGGTVCVGTQEGAACYDHRRSTAEGSWEPTKLLRGLPDARVHAIVIDDGGMLVATEGGVAAYGPTPVN